METYYSYNDSDFEIKSFKISGIYTNEDLVKKAEELSASKDYNYIYVSRFKKNVILKILNDLHDLLDDPYNPSKHNPYIDIISYYEIMFKQEFPNEKLEDYL